MGLLGGFKMKTLLKNSPALRLAPISSSYIATITAEIFFSACIDEDVFVCDRNEKIIVYCARVSNQL